MAGGFAAVLAGTVVLYFAAGLLIRGASGLARSFGVAPAVIGLTVVAFGTSLPELVVSLTAAVRGNADIALGNVVGSNIANMGLILGLAASIRAMSVDFHLVKREVPMGLGAVVIVIALSLDGAIGRGDALILLAAFAGFVFWSVRVERVAPDAVQTASEKVVSTRLQKGKQGGAFLVGLLGVLAGAHLLVEGGVRVAEILGIPAVIIGLSLVAVGTSLPELAASLAAMAHGEDDISVGNVLGSNLFNLLGVLGAAALVDPIEVPQTFFRFQYPVLAAFSLALLPICRTGWGISRAEGGGLLCCYVGYVAALYLLPGLQ